MAGAPLYTQARCIPALGRLLVRQHFPEIDYTLERPWGKYRFLSVDAVVGQGTIRHFFGELTASHVAALASSLQAGLPLHNTTIMFGCVRFCVCVCVLQ